MSVAPRIHKPQRTPTPPPGGFAQGLTARQVDEAHGRLALLAFVYAAVYTVMHVVMRLSAPHEMAVLFGPVLVNDLTWLAYSSLALLLAFWARGRKLRPSQLITVGLLFEVVGSTGIEIWILYHPLPTEIGGLTWNCVWILIFPIILPSPTGRMLLASIASGLMSPAFYLIALSQGKGPLPPGMLLDWWLPIAICVGLAYISCRVIYRLRSEASRAERLGSYRLVERLGAGGMGEVWRAEHGMLARPAAVKIIRPETIGARDEQGKRELLARFNREVQATSLLSSPHTVSVYDYGVTEEGTFYYVMEYLRGLDLGVLLDRFGPLAPERVAHLLGHICDSLAEAHASGLVHRDIKPANIYVCRLGNQVDVAKVLDFGLVKSSGGEDQETRLTLPEVTAGTPAFMAPEMVTGEGVIDGRSDIYSLGCVAYWMLTGELVFTGGTPMQTAFAHANTAPDPPSSRTELPVPRDLEAVIMACLAKDPRERPASANDLARRLEGSVESTWTPDRARTWWRKHLPDLLADRPGVSASGADPTALGAVTR